MHHRRGAPETAKNARLRMRCACTACPTSGGGPTRSTGLCDHSPCQCAPLFDSHRSTVALPFCPRLSV